MSNLEETVLKNLDVFTGFARKRLNDPHLAADAVQDSLLKALQAKDQPEDSTKMIPWFYRILRRTIIDLYRRQDARRRTLDRASAEGSIFGTEAEEEAAVCQCFNALLKSLPKQYRELLQEVELNGRPPADMAKEKGISASNFHVRLHRARQALRKQLEQTCGACSVHGCLDCNCSDEESELSSVQS